MSSDIQEKTDPLAKARAAKAAKKAAQAAELIATAKDPETMTPEELKVEHERLQAALDALPFVGEKVKDQEPGTRIGEGLTSEYVPFTRAWFENVEARRQDRNLHNGKPAELKWPNYQLHEVNYPGPAAWLDVTVNGVRYTLRPDITCKLPTPHYARYVDMLQGGRKNDARFAQPTHAGTAAGYMHVNPDTGLAVILGKGPLQKDEQ